MGVIAKNIGKRFLYRFITKPDDILKILLLNVITKTARTFIYYLKVVRSLQVGTDVCSISCLSRQSAQSRSQCTFLEMYLGQQTACSNSSVLPVRPKMRCVMRFQQPADIARGRSSCLYHTYTTLFEQFCLHTTRRAKRLHKLN